MKGVKTAPNRFFVAVDLSKCVGCNVCEYICELEKAVSSIPSGLGLELPICIH